MNHLKQTAYKACAYVNSKLELENANCCVLEDAKEIDDIYATYTGPKEFLYIPPFEEILETIAGDDAVYLGYRINGELVAIAKVSKLELPSSFFVPPKSEGRGNYYGCSGLLVKEGNRGKHLAQRLVNLTSSIAYVEGGNGIYADFDYRNSASMRVISKLFNFVGFTDGRNGAEGEKTIYTTFYLPLKNREKAQKTKGKNIKIPCHCAEDAKNNILKVMSQASKYCAYKVPYGGEGCYNMIYVMDNVSDFERFEISREVEGVKDDEFIK